MQKIKRNIPNAITCGNLLCGCLALVKAFEGDLIWTAYLVGIAVLLDFFDGFTARMLNVSSAIGKDLDSLADMVTFGVVPGVVMFQLMKSANLIERGFTNEINVLEVHESIWNQIPYIAFLIPIFSAIRLAKFNNDVRQSDSFIGLPTPAGAIFFCSLPLLMKQITSKYETDKNPLELLVDVSSNPYLALLNNPFVLLILTLIFSFLLVSPLPLFALKFKNFGWKENEIRFVFLGLSVALLAVFQFVGIPLIILLYILMSIVNNLVTKK